MIKEFKKYVKIYNFNDYRIKGKYKHSFSVMKMCEFISKKLKLNKADIKLAKQIGLLHDIGRFEQIDKYNTFYDSKSVNHGELGAKILFENNYIDKFKINKENYDIIKLAIINHNKNNIDEGLTKRENLFCGMIRDADKIDIFRILPDYINIKDTKVDDRIQKEFFNNQKTTMVYEKNDADILIRVLSFIYDVNLDCSLKYIKRKKLFKKLSKKINNSAFDKYFEKANNYINERIDLNVKN